jgi:hypothetical protein
MKKVILTLSVVSLLASCNSATETKVETVAVDSVAVDSVKVAVDSVAVDSVKTK